MSLLVSSPVAGTVVDVLEVPDPVFSAGLVGPGTAVEPEGTQVVSPVDGRVVKLHPHAFVVQPADGPAVLVHLGIDTVQLGGAGFTLHVAEGDEVVTGQLVVEWDPVAVRDGGRSAVCPVVLLEADPERVDVRVGPGGTVGPGDPLLAVR